MTVVMMGQMSLDNSVDKSEKKNNQDQVAELQSSQMSNQYDLHVKLKCHRH